jgi:hypothetical protein
VHELVKDGTVRLNFTRAFPTHGVELLPGEAREMAAALLAAADIMLFEKHERR